MSVEDMLAKARFYHRFVMPKGTELAHGATDVIVTYKSLRSGGKTELQVAQEKALYDKSYHHEPVDMFYRQGFSGSTRQIDRLEEELKRKGFKPNTP